MAGSGDFAYAFCFCFTFFAPEQNAQLLTARQSLAADLVERI